MWITFYVAVSAVLFIQLHAQPEFISINCGSQEGYTDPLLINYVSDADFINTGVSGTISSEENSRYNTQRQLWTLRSFPEGRRNCYKINVTRASKYLIRTTFLYGNYDGRNILPQFDLLIGPNPWGTVTIFNAAFSQFKEIIHVPSMDYVQICLVHTGNGIPFITAIEFRTLKYDAYVIPFGSMQLYNYLRCDLGSHTSYRYPVDVYDRVWYARSHWSACNFGENWKSLSSSNPDNFLNQNGYKPGEIMSTAVEPENDSAPLVISWEPQNETDQFYVYMYFTEIQVLTKNQTRQFNIMLNAESLLQNFSPRYQIADTINATTAISGKEIKFSLERTENSTLPPIISAIEIYRVIDSQNPETFQGDVDAITSIKSAYGMEWDWEGDPCAPAAYLWDGLNCTYLGNEFPRITALNLSSSGLSGKIDSSISNLTMLEKLDLSNNNLNGEVPDFLSQLQHLKTLKLEKNFLSGSIPSALVEKSREGSLSLSVDQNLYTCESGQCNEKKKKNTATRTAIVASTSGVSFILIAVGILWIFKRKQSKVEKFTDSVAVNHQIEISQQSTEKDNSFQQGTSQKYSYYDVLQITNNLNRIIGKGGFGTVYLGFIDETPVAVKMLSPSAVHGYQQFQAEVKLLIRVHHKNLISLIGYCNEGTNKGLIYEYMAKGNLREHLSGKHNESPFLSWKDRLRVAVDAAVGLEYLHNGCKSPIIHRDVKSSNILLDEHFQAKLSDFGLSKVFPEDGRSHVSTIVAGTLGYLDPHYHSSNRLTQKSDVYSFGVVLLEIITNQSVMAGNEETGHISERVNSMIPKGDIRAIVDSSLEGNFDIKSAWKAVKIALVCVSPNPNERPMMNVVVSELQEALATEVARTNHDSGADTRYSVAPVSENVDSEIMPSAR
ncbi:LRR receptor-like serine/threonine-protein kinase IOS1 [Vigna radiata var. radiata]|uniref:non-specific serine/threonine protein kinase n=1 Tax=Vigna radiata var. radiata TaxID=3916 RepID=A0A1S3U3F0_VIGRR|nr:LRR receptor-like serine/threonine-protein kinase IOS1 [Vigna radiata var. radiata]